MSCRTSESSSISKEVSVAVGLSRGVGGLTGWAKEFRIVATFPSKAARKSSAEREEGNGGGGGMRREEKVENSLRGLETHALILDWKNEALADMRADVKVASRV